MSFGRPAGLVTVKQSKHVNNPLGQISSHDSSLDKGFSSSGRLEDELYNVRQQNLELKKRVLGQEDKTKKYYGPLDSP